MKRRMFLASLAALLAVLLALPIKPDCPYDFKDTGLSAGRIVLLSACAVVAAGAIGYGIYKHKSRKGGASNG